MEGQSGGSGGEKQMQGGWGWRMVGEGRRKVVDGGGAAAAAHFILVVFDCLQRERF